MGPKAKRPLPLTTSAAWYCRHNAWGRPANRAAIRARLLTRSGKIRNPWRLMRSHQSMVIDFSLFGRIAEAVIIAVLGGFSGRGFERQPLVVVFYWHVVVF